MHQHKMIRQVGGEEEPSSSSRVSVSSKPTSSSVQDYSGSTTNDSAIQSGGVVVASPASQETTMNFTMEKAIQRLIELQINFVALDFDLTVIDMHTGGRWKKSAEELTRHHIRPEFRRLIASCLNTTSIHVAIVTFTSQTDLVKHAMEDIVGVERASRIPIRGDDDTWSYHPVVGDESMSMGKQAHMASAVEELKETRDHAGHNTVEITKNTMLLIDDDERNIRYAAKNGIRGILFNPEQPHDLIRKLARLD